ncbi:hypothetical protein M1E17_04480 [Arthrobacter sp. D1-29]
MTFRLLARLRSRLADVFLCESVDQAAGAMADATRWGWLPALSGVAAGADEAMAAHAGASVPPSQGFAGRL